MGDCPFASGKHTSRKLPMGHKKRALLYEEYTFVRQMREVWDSPLTANPLEPMFVAGMHGIEQALLLLTDFLVDKRTYVSKIGRVNRTVEDIELQCQLLVEITTASFEISGACRSMAHPFPLSESLPIINTPSNSPSLKYLERSFKAALRESTSESDRVALTDAVRALSLAFARFESWSVGLGIEPQIDSLREVVGLPPQARKSRDKYLDYTQVVRPEVPETTYTTEVHPNPEDYFFRTVNGSTDCWAFVILGLVRASRANADAGHWTAAAHINHLMARILEYMGSHVQLLMEMNLRDYLMLKVELEGTSGEGSVLCKSMRNAIKGLLRPLVVVLLGVGAAEVVGLENSNADEELGLALMEVYENPELNKEWYTYAKSLEDLESGLLGGFYYKHFSLATNVIGNDAKGTSESTVKALKVTYENPVFLVLDRVKHALGVKMDSQNEALKGRVMDKIVRAYVVGKEPSWQVRQMARLQSARSMLIGRSQKSGRFARFTSKLLNPGVVEEIDENEAK
jgi:tryptophan 2,3-dioxygenase